MFDTDFLIEEFAEALVNNEACGGFSNDELLVLVKMNDRFYHKVYENIVYRWDEEKANEIFGSD